VTGQIIGSDQASYYLGSAFFLGTGLLAEGSAFLQSFCFSGSHFFSATGFFAGALAGSAAKVVLAKTKAIVATKNFMLISYWYFITLNGVIGLSSKISFQTFLQFRINLISFLSSLGTRMSVVDSVVSTKIESHPHISI
jgi:hypothetical protein